MLTKLVLTQGSNVCGIFDNISDIFFHIRKHHPSNWGLPRADGNSDDRIRRITMRDPSEREETYYYIVVTEVYS